MNVEEFRIYCLSKKGVTEGFPFDEVTLVFKVMGKMFAITGLDEEECKVNLKCDPERSVVLREKYPEDILPGYHMNKQHWNTVRFETGLEEALLKDLVDHSYDLIVKSLPKKTQATLHSL